MKWMRANYIPFYFTDAYVNIHAKYLISKGSIPQAKFFSEIIPVKKLVITRCYSSPKYYRNKIISNVGYNDLYGRLNVENLTFNYHQTCPKPFITALFTPI